MTKHLHRISRRLQELIAMSHPFLFQAGRYLMPCGSDMSTRPFDTLKEAKRWAAEIRGGYIIRAYFRDKPSEVVAERAPKSKRRNPAKLLFGHR